MPQCAHQKILVLAFFGDSKRVLLLLQQISRILEESHFDIESDASLSRACSLELKDHCGDIPKGDGQSMLTSVIEPLKLFAVMIK